MTIKLPDYNNANVLVFGDVMLDRYWAGDAGRISPEAPVPVVRIAKCDQKPGGAANVALNVNSLGAAVEIFGMVGDDPEGLQLNTLLSEAGVRCHLLSDPSFPTITKVRVIAHNQQLLRMDFEKGQHIDAQDSLLDVFSERLPQASVIVLSDYAKGVLQNPKPLIDLANAQGKRVMIDPKSNQFNRYAGAFLVTPNLKEFEHVVGECATEEILIERAQQLLETCSIENILVTRGKDGMTLVTRTGEITHIATEARNVYDVTGAGDTVIGVMAASLAAGASLSDAARLANMAAGIVVGELGAASVTVSDLARVIAEQTVPHVGMLDESHAMQWSQYVQSQGETVVFTNGCFDILHAGHIQYLREAKALGDYLIVAVNSDESVKQLKGDTRPYNKLQERMEMLAALDMVDVVISFGEETPARIIEALLPNVLVKGGDYQVKDIVGADTVLAHGGEVKMLSFRDGCSTTGLVDRILKTQQEGEPV